MPHIPRMVNYLAGFPGLDAGPGDPNVTLPSTDLYNGLDLLGVGSASNWWVAPEHHVMWHQNLHHGIRLRLNLTGRHNATLSHNVLWKPKFSRNRVPRFFRVGDWEDEPLVDGKDPWRYQTRTDHFGFDDETPIMGQRYLWDGMYGWNQGISSFVSSQDGDERFVEGERVEVEYEPPPDWPFEDPPRYDTWLSWSFYTPLQAGGYNKRILGWNDDIDLDHRVPINIYMQYGQTADDGSIVYNSNWSDLYYQGSYTWPDYNNSISYVEVSPLTVNLIFPDGAEYHPQMLYDPDALSAFHWYDDEDGPSVIPEITGSIDLIVQDS